MDHQEGRKGAVDIAHANRPTPLGRSREKHPATEHAGCFISSTFGRPGAFSAALTQVDDWQQFFREKSVRRAKRERLRLIGPPIVWAVVVGTAVASAIAAVSTR